MNFQELKQKLEKLLVHSSDEEFLASINDEDIEYFSTVPSLGFLNKNRQSVAIITLFNKAFRDKQNAWAQINDNKGSHKSFIEKQESQKSNPPSKTFGGVFSTAEEAIEYCKRNPSSMDDAGYYDLLVIEEICLGGSIIPHKETWMRLKNNHHHYILTKKPGWSVGVCGYLG